MKTLFFLFLFLTLGYLGCSAWDQISRLEQVRIAQKTGRPDLVEGYLADSDGPIAFVNPQAKQIWCQLAWKDRTRQLARDDRFEEAVLHVRELDSSCGITPERSDAMLKDLALAQLTRASDLCERKQYRAALRGFESVVALYPESYKALGRDESAWCRLSYADSLLDQGQERAAIDQATRALAATDPTARHTASRKIVTLAQHHLTRLMDRNAWVPGATFLNDLKTALGGQDEEVAGLLSDLELAFFERAFLGAFPEGEEAVPPVVAVHDLPANLQGRWWWRPSVQFVSDLKVPITVVIRGDGTEQRLRLTNKTSARMTVLAGPGQYLVGLIPEEGKYLPSMSVVSLGPATHAQYRLTPGAGQKPDLIMASTP